MVDTHEANVSFDTDGAIKKLFVVYNQLPKIECKGECATECGLVDALPIEDFNIKMFNRINGFPQKHFLNTSNQKVIRHYKNRHTDENDGCVTCPYLTKDNRCDIYYARPLVCRLYGVAESLKCSYGCKPERYMTDLEVMAFIKQIRDLTQEMG